MSKLPKSSGYDGLSMSLRAREAYQEGKMPKSKWNKKEILHRIKDAVGEDSVKFEKFKKDVLLKVMLRDAGWHHTSYKMNMTTFYEVDISLANMNKKLNQCKQETLLLKQN